MVKIEFSGKDLKQLTDRIRKFMEKNSDEQQEVLDTGKDPRKGHRPGNCSLCGKFSKRVKIHEAHCRKRIRAAEKAETYGPSSDALPIGMLIP